MKLKLGMKAFVYKVVENEFKDNSGKDVKFYKVHCEQGGDVASVSCSEDCSSDIQPMKENNLFCEFDTETRKLRITGVAAAK